MLVLGRQGGATALPPGSEITEGEQMPRRNPQEGPLAQVPRLAGWAS
jgi:hypothetical protein